MLTVTEVGAGYHGLRMLHDVSLTVDEGELVALVGANGAGKTTILRTISGLLRPYSGRIDFDGGDLTRLPVHEIVRAGLVQVPEGRDLFGPLTVAENLDMGGIACGPADRRRALREVHELFPELAERRTQRADTMSGGQQQMLAIGRALMARPRLLMLDEPSIGLAPRVVRTVLEAVRAIRDRGRAVLLVEQNAARALEISDRAYVMESGSIVASGPSAAIAADSRVRRAYLGM